MAERVLVPIADGTEEIEAVTVIDVLRRAGAEVTVAGVDKMQVTCSRGVKLVADKLLSECVDQEYDLVVLAGGLPGAEHLRDSAELADLLVRQKQAGKLYGAICSAPALVLEHHGLLEGKKATAHPDFAGKLKNQEAVPSRVVVDGACVTSRAPGTAMEFALELVRQLYGDDKAVELAEQMLVSA